MRAILFAVLLFFSSVCCDVCPGGFDLVSGQGCYQNVGFYDVFYTRFVAKSFNEAEAYCNDNGGGALLASIHSPEEEQYILDSSSNCNHENPYFNIGLRCEGAICKWDDGSAVTYTNFMGSPPADTKIRCYAVATVGYDIYWQERGCGQITGDCWICKMRGQINCNADETPYKGGCVSIQTDFVDQKTAQKSCPGGGQLASIHGWNENTFYQNLALAAGVNGSFYIGGQFTNGAFVWTDNSYYNWNYWAKSFPNTIFGTCVQMILGSEFGSQGQWTNIDCNTKQPSICIRFGAIEDEPTAPPAPEGPQAAPLCPLVQYYTGTGNVISPNYPLYIPSEQTCEYVIGTVEGTKASIQFTSYDCESGTSLSLFDGLNSKKPFLTFSLNAPSLNVSYTSGSSVMKILFLSNKEPVGKGWTADFNGV